MNTLALMQTQRQLSPNELNEIAHAMVTAKTPQEAERLKQQYIAGFYGETPPTRDAQDSTFTLPQRTP